MFKVILHTVDNGAVLSLLQRTFPRRADARKHALRCAKEYARRGFKMRALAGDKWTLHKSNGVTVAQFDVV